MLIGLPPLFQADAISLILGSMPSEASLQSQSYYANPRNSFRRLIAELFNADTRCPDWLETTLQQRRIALWDVIASCQRDGSMDSNIDKDSIQVNDFAVFFQKQKYINRVFFNGRTAASVYKRMVLGNQPLPTGISYQALPSTSPAHARLSYQDKLASWSCIGVN